jgi:hypothetical protein
MRGIPRGLSTIVAAAGSTPRYKNPAAAHGGRGGIWLAFFIISAGTTYEKIFFR